MYPESTVAVDDTRVLAVEGMTCEACAVHIRSELESVPGVSRASVSYQDKTASVVLVNPDILDAALIRAVEAAGYKAQLRRGATDDGVDHR